MSNEIDLRKVKIFLEASARYWLHDQNSARNESSELVVQGTAITEAGVVLLSATLQSYVQSVFLECSAKALHMNSDFTGQDWYPKTFQRWGNPSHSNIQRLFQRLGIEDVFANVSFAGEAGKEEFIETLSVLNSARNCIAHGKLIQYNGSELQLNRRLLSEWTRVVERGSKSLRISALYQSGLGAKK